MLTRALHRPMVDPAVTDQHRRRTVDQQFDPARPRLARRQQHIRQDQRRDQHQRVGQRTVLPDKGILRRLGDQQNQDEIELRHLRQGSPP